MSTAETAPQPPALAAARQFAARGWRPFPLDHPDLTECAAAHRRRPCDGKRGKHPVGGWGTQTASAPTDGMLRLWFGTAPRNIGIAAGPSRLLILDEDQPGALVALAEHLGEKIPDTYRVLTSRGWHWYFADPDNQFGNSPGLLGEHGIDVRGGNGAGGYVVAAGSRHSSGVDYTAEDSHAEVAALPEWIATLLRTPAPGIDGQPQAPGDGSWTDQPRYGTPDELRAQYQRHLDGVRTPGGEFRHQLFLAALDGWRLADIGLLDEHTMLRQIREAILEVWKAEPDDDDRQIVYTEAREKATSSPWRVLDPFAAASATSGPGAAERPSWEPLDLGPYLSGQRTPAAPTLGLARRDGVRLLYPGKEHAVIGEMESGKSWFSLACVLAELEAGQRVIYVHFEEDDPSDTLKRLMLLGATRGQLTDLFAFVAPETAITAGAVEHLVATAPSLVVLDGQNEAMALHGFGIREEDGAAAYRARLVKPFTAVGAAVLSCDHVVKDVEKSTRGYALGSIHKGNGLNGTLILLENEDPFGVGRRGASRVYVTKDRPGQVRQHGQPTTVARKFFMGVLSVDASKAVHGESTGSPRESTDVHNPSSDQSTVELAFWPPRPDAGDADDVLLLGTNWHDVLGDEQQVPDQVAMLRGSGSAAARDIFRALRWMNDPDGKTMPELRQVLAEGPRVHKRSALFAARPMLLDAGICEQGSTPARLALNARFAGPVDGAR